jgi:hypothetical protein
MRTVVMFFFFLLLSGCSLNNLYVAGELNKVTVVQYSSYMKHYRAYFTRTDLQTIKDDQKYLYLYNAKEHNLGILLHRKNQYILYSLSNPEQQALAIKTSPKTTYKHVLKSFKRKGFELITSVDTVGYIVSVAPRRYKGVKTLLVESQDYSHLQKLYQHAIKTYNADKIINIKTKLPKHLVYADYTRYAKRAKTHTQWVQLQIIAQKLQMTTEEKSTQYKLYIYYLNDASFEELSTYISHKDTKESLSYKQYTMLKGRKAYLEKEKLLNKGSLEDLIAAYKINKNPKYKNRIMSIMKEQQEDK